MLTNNSESQDQKNNIDTNSSIINKEELSSTEPIETESQVGSFWQKVNPFQTSKTIK